MVLMGDGAGWGRPSNYTSWINLIGKGAGIDTAWDYGTQQNIPPQILASDYNRADVFLTTKIPCGGYDGAPEPITADFARAAVAKNLRQLNTSYIDLMLLHHTCGTQNETEIVWRVLEDAKQSGQARHIGVSNFVAADLKELLRVAVEPIAANQCHFAVGQIDNTTIEFCRAHGIALESYGSLHGSVPMDHPAIVRVAARHNTSTALVMLRYVTMQGIAVVTASSNEIYQREDATMFHSLVLTAEDRMELDSVQGGRAHTCNDCWTKPCRDCQAALKQAGCAPFGGPSCARCAERHSVAVSHACASDDMIQKACTVT